MTAERTSVEVQGIIACVASNGRGLKLQGDESWRNLSKWAEVAAIPAKGSVVVLGLDRSGYIREISTEPNDSQSGNAAGPNELSNLDSSPTGGPDRETRITRSASINAAIEVLRTRGPVDLDELLVYAARIEKWVGR